MTDVFLFGPLAHGPVLDVVVGARVAARPAQLSDARLATSPDAFGAALGAAFGVSVDGVVLTLSDQSMARLAHLATSFGLTEGRVTVSSGSGPGDCVIFRRSAAAVAPDWDGDLWRAQDATLMVETAVGIMAVFGQHSPAQINRRIEQMRVRAASTLRARSDDLPATHRTAAGQVQVTALRQPYAHFFAVEEYDLCYSRFGGGQSDTVTRAVFISGDAVTVLPYDPVRDRVLVVEQFRSGPFARGDARPWLLEAIAGRVDPDEPPETCARREAVEEAGLTLGALHLVSRYYPSPGAKSEFIYSYVAIADLPDGCTGVFGVEDEAEDIRGHLVSFPALMDMVASGEVANAPLILTALWLQRERARLRA